MIKNFLFKLIIMSFIFTGNVEYISANQNNNSTNSFDIPIIKKSEQWRVELNKVKKYKNKMTKPKKNINEMFSLVITNTGKDIYDVYITGYSLKLNSENKHRLFTSEALNIKKTYEMKHGETFTVANLPVSLNSKEVEINLTWKKQISDTYKDREYKECRQTFTFTK